MEAGRSFSSLFPISQNQIILARSQQALRNQEQMRKKEVQLQTQLQLICQRQRNAHRRNQDLLKDFKRIEQELSLLTAKSDSFRKKQEKYKKQMYPFIPEQSKHAAANSTTSTMGHGYIKQFNDFQAPHYDNLCEPCCFSASVGHAVQPPIHFNMCPNQKLGLQGCCNPSWCCGLVHRHCDGQFGSFIPDACKILDSTRDCQAQKKKCATKDISAARNVMFIPNTKKDVIQHCPEFVCDKDSTLKWRETPTYVHGNPLQCILSSEMYSDWKEKILKEEQQQIVGEHVVETAVKQSKEDFRKRPACHIGSSISEYSLKPLDTSSKSHHPSVLPTARDHNTKDSSKPASKKQTNKQVKTIYEMTTDEVAADQNIEEALCKEQVSRKTGSHEIKLGLKLSNAPDSFACTGINERTSNHKTVESSDKGKDWCEQQTTDSSEVENVHEETIVHPDPKRFNPPGHLHQHEKEKDLGFLVTFLKESIEEFIDSNEEDDILPKGSNIFHVVQENDNSKRCRSSEDEPSQEEASVSSHLSVEGNGSTDNKHSPKEKTLEMEVQGSFREMVQHNQSLCADNSFVINEDKKNGIMNLDISEQDTEFSDESESQMEERKLDDGNIGMLTGNNRFISPGLSENNTGHIYRVVGERERFKGMLTEEIEKSSSEEDRKSEEKSEAESSVPERVYISTVRERDPQRQVNIKEETEAEESEEERTSAEDETSLNDSQESLIDNMDDVIHGITKGEPSISGDDRENKLTKKRRNQTECNKGNNIISEEEMSDKADISDEERLSSEGLDESDDIDSSEEEENTDFWGSRHEENDSDIEEIEKLIQLQSSSTEDSTKQVNADASAREEEPQGTVQDVAAASCQDLLEDEEVNSEKQRSSWFCCLKTCSLPHILNKSSEHQSQGKRCSEDVIMDMLQMHPVEFGSSLPAEETAAGSIANVHTEAASVAETNAEDSNEETLHCEKESENHNQPWSDSEDNVHSFYD